MDYQNEFKRLLNLADFSLDYESLENEFIDLNKLAAKVAGTEISQLNLIDNFIQWSVSQVGTKGLQIPRDKTICTYTVEGEKTVEILDLSNDQRFKNLESVKESGAKYYFGIPIISEEGYSIGSFCVISLKRLKLSDEKKELLTIIAKEITERLETKRKINEVKKENSELQYASREIAHDLRGMINGIMGLGDLIEMESDDDNSDVEKYVEMMKGSCKSIIEYADDILSIKEREEESEDSISLKELSNKLKRLYQPLAIKKGLDFKVSYTEEHAGISFQSKTIVQIIGNLVSNAMKFTSKKGKVSVILYLIKNEQDSKESGYQLEIAVIDNGTGMNQETIDSILEKSITSSEGTGGEKGYGLGLNLVQHHIEELNGTLKIDSISGKGSTFQVSIPIN